MMKRRSSRQNSSSSNGPHEFFKVFLPDQSSKQLKIPPAFAKHIKGPLPMISILEGPTDKAWFVNLKKVDDYVILEKGWEGFVEDNCLEFGDFLMFSYNGFSKFNVTLYGNNGCEKEIAAKKLQKRSKRGNSDEDLTHGNGAIRVKVEENRETPIESDLVANENDKPTRKVKCRTSGPRPVRGDQKAKSRKSQQLSHKENKAKQIRKQALRPRRSSVILQNDTAAKAAKKFKSNYPHFMVFMYKSCITRGPMTIPIGFAKKYMKRDQRYEKNSKVKLQISNKAWNVNLKVYSRRTYKLSTGWLAFAKANHLREGDVCVFELTDMDNFVLEVSIFRN